LKILHTGDWHLGKIVNQVYMTEDQEYILEELIRIIEEEKPDVLVIAGDIYDRAVPPVEAVELLDRTFNRILRSQGIPILAIAGNHDSPERLGFCSGIMEGSGLFIEGGLKETIRKVTLTDSFGPVNFYLIPYADPAEARAVFKDEEIRSHEDAFKAVLKRIRGTMDPKERNVVLGHGFITGAAALEQSDSERPLSIGGTDYVDAGLFQGFEYTALGHLHSAQKVTDAGIRYAGSLLKYSFSEVRHHKSAVLVTLRQKGEGLEIELKPLKPIREMRIIKGKLPELIKAGEASTSQDYIRAVLTDEGELIDPMNKLRTVYPNVLELVREGRDRTAGDSRTSAGEGYKHKTKMELFRSFYENITGEQLTNDKEEVMRTVIGQVDKEERG
jgi:DNA repair protein SbcD/Mre11